MSVLAEVAFGPAAARRPESLYQREIAPHEKKLVWYRFDKKLPEVSPPKQEPDSQPPGAEVKHPDQTIVARSNRSDAARQLILAPGPELKIQQELDSPNLMAFETPKPPNPPPQPKLFMPPPRIARATEQPDLENGPTLASDNRLEQIPVSRVPKPAPKAFVPPQAAKRVETPQLQPGEARIDAAPLDQIPLAQIPRPKPRAFTAPPSPTPRANAALTLPSAPALPSQAPQAVLLAGIQAPARPQPRPFAPPPQPAKRVEPAPILPSAPALGPAQGVASLAGVPSKISLPARPQPKPFTAPVGRAAPAAPAIALERPTSNLTAAVVGLNPIERAMPLIPEGSRPAQFSAAPELSPGRGVGGSAEPGAIVLPGLTIRGAPPKKESIATIARIAPTSKENLLAAAPPVVAPTPVSEAAPPKPSIGAVRVSGAPDPRFEGRIVFTVAIQMPNVTSYSGSWILWYAERKGPPGEAPDILPPAPLRKVDPVYDLSAAEDRVEGKVQLAAVIHKDGYVYGITVLRGVDARLDKGAVAALRKWEFEPARRDGAPVDVDVVIEIPFRLRPLLKKK
jgi:TonB family protein